MTQTIQAIGLGGFIYDFILGYGYIRGYKSLEIINNSVVGRFK
jgi:hypothetical protein